MKRIYYIANIRMPTEKAHGIQIMKMCEAFANQGIMVELWVPTRRTFIKDDPYEYYQVKNNFKIRKIWCLDLIKFGKLGFWIETLTFSKFVSLVALFKKGTFYTRDEVCAVYLKFILKKVVWEAHMGHANLFTSYLLKCSTPIVVITNGLKDRYVKLGAKNKILVSPDGVDLIQFDINTEKNEARDKIELPVDKKIVMYTGHLYSWKGADTLAIASDFLKKNILTVFIGGTRTDSANFQEKYKSKNILVLPKKNQKDIPICLKAADILVIPNTNKEDISKLYTSPMKLFEYMASKRPIIASNLPSLREIIDDNTAYFFEADDSIQLAEIITQALEDTEQSNIKATRALEKVKEYTWDIRAQKILQFIK